MCEEWMKKKQQNHQKAMMVARQDEIVRVGFAKVVEQNRTKIEILNGCDAIRRGSTNGKNSTEFVESRQLKSYNDNSCTVAP